MVVCFKSNAGMFVNICQLLQYLVVNPSIYSLTLLVMSPLGNPNP
jgi:hypothetical protein